MRLYLERGFVIGVILIRDLEAEIGIRQFDDITMIKYDTISIDQWFVADESFVDLLLI